MKKYFPILVSKQAELKALESLKQEAKERIAPIIKVIPEIFFDGWADKKKNAEKKSDENRINKGMPPVDRSERKQKEYENILLTSLGTHWSFPENQILLDFIYCSATLPQYIKDFLESLNSKGINVIPVISATTSQAIIDISLEFAVKYSRPLSLRFDLNSFNRIHDESIFNKLIENHGIGKENIVLLLDGGVIEEHTYGVIKKDLIENLSNLQDIGTWFEIIVGFGSFPKDLSDINLIARKEPHLLKRHEWVLWQDIKKANVCNGRVKYADYGIKHPVYEDAPFLGTASIKYTVTNYFVIYKGKKSGDTELGNAQYIMHAKELVTSEYYSGEGFSWGDDRIIYYSKTSPQPLPPKKPNGKQRRPKSGAAKEWIALGQNHHLALMESLL